MHSSVFPAVFYNITFQFEYFTYFFSNFFLSTSFSSFSSSPCSLSPPPPHPLYRFSHLQPKQLDKGSIIHAPSQKCHGEGRHFSQCSDTFPLASLDVFPTQHGTPWNTARSRNKVLATHQHIYIIYMHRYLTSTREVLTSSSQLP